MRKRFIGVLVAAMLLSTFVLGGCSQEVTAESLIEQMNANTEKAKSFVADMDMDMSMNISAEGIAMDMDIGMAGTIEATTDPEVAHMDMNMEMSMLGMSMDMDIYTQATESKLITYTGMAGQWTKVEEDYAPEEGAASQLMFTDLGGMTLAKETEDHDGKEVYVLNATITGEDLQEVMNQMGTMTSDLSGMDFSTLQADVVMKVYKDTILPASVSLELKDGGEGTEVDGVITKLNSVSMVMNYTAFDTLETIEIPAEALAAETVDTDALMQTIQ